MGNNDPEKTPDGRHFRRLAILFFILVPVVIIVVIMALRLADSKKAAADFQAGQHTETAQNTQTAGEGKNPGGESPISFGQAGTDTGSNAGMIAGTNLEANSDTNSGANTGSLPDGTELNPDAPPYITELFHGYFQAKLGNDAALVNSYFTGGKEKDQEEESRRLLWSLEYIEDYRDITCYTIPGPAEDSLIVYTAYKIKFYQSEVPASSLSAAYVVKDEDGIWKIFDGAMGGDLKEYMEQAAQLDSVKALDRQVQEAFMRELSEDERLAEIYSIAMNIPKTSEEPSGGHSNSVSDPSQADGKTGESKQ